MGYYRLGASDRSDSKVDGIILSNNEDGEPGVTLSTGEAVELSDDQLSKAQQIAGRVGAEVIEAEPPEEREEASQPVGDDVKGQAVVGDSAAASGAADTSPAPASTSTAASESTSGSPPPTGGTPNRPATSTP